VRALVASPLTPINGLAREWVSRADAVICVSNRQCEIMRERMPEIRDKSVVIYNPLPDVLPVRKELGDDSALPRRFQLREGFPPCSQCCQ
jgi:hypothetical protein